MANDFTILPNFGDTQGANTAVLPDSNQVINSYLTAAQLDFQKREAQRKADQEEVDARVKALSPDISGAWEIDKPELTKQMQGLADYVEQNPDSLSPTTGNPQSIQHAAELQRMDNEIHYLATKSGQDKIKYYQWLSKVADKPDEYANPDVQKTFDDFKAGGVNRGDLVLPPPTPKANIITLAKGWETAATTGKTDQSTTSTAPGGQLKNTTTTTSNIDYSKIPQYATATYNSDPTWKRIADNAYSKLSDADKAKYNNDPSQVLVDMAIPYISGEQVTKDRFRQNWMDQFAAKQKAAKPDVTWIVDNMNALDLLPPIQRTGDTVNPQPSQMSTAWNGTPITLPGGQQDVVTGVFKVGGTLYARPASLQNADGSIKFTDLQPITNKRNQLVIPFIKDNVGKGQILGTTQDILNTYDRSVQDTDALKASQQAGQSRMTKAKALLDSKGLNSDDASIKLFLKNNPNFK